MNSTFILYLSDPDPYSLSPLSPTLTGSSFFRLSFFIYPHRIPDCSLHSRNPDFHLQLVNQQWNISHSDYNLLHNRPLTYLHFICLLLLETWPAPEKELILLCPGWYSDFSFSRINLSAEGIDHRVHGPGMDSRKYTASFLFADLNETCWIAYWLLWQKNLASRVKRT